MKDRLFALCLSGSVLLSLTACGPSDPAPAQPQPDPPAAEEVERVADTVVIGGQEFGAGLDIGEMMEEMDSDPDREIDRAVAPIQPSFAEKLDGTPLTEEFYIYRGTLNETYRQAYDQIRSGILAGQESIRMTVPVAKEDMFDIYKKVLFDGTDLFWAETNGAKYRYNKKGLVTEFIPGYNDLAKDIEGNRKRMEEATLEALADLWSLPTQLEKVKYAHDYLTHTVNYVLTAPYNQTAFSALVNRESVCAGYSHAMQYLLQKVGVPCYYMLGSVSAGGHAWNQVMIDGEFYAMDVTWDDPVGASPDKYYYNYFNITDEAISATHARMAISAFIPQATATVCSYENAFGGDAYGTDFQAIVGVLPEKQEDSEIAANPYL